MHYSFYLVAPDGLSSLMMNQQNESMDTVRHNYLLLMDSAKKFPGHTVKVFRNFVDITAEIA